LDAQILYEDAELVAVDKPAGLAVIPERDGEPSASLRHRLEASRGEPLWVVHRIDKDTSGVVVLARSASAHRWLNDAFAERRVAKKYLAFAAGDLPGERVVDVALVEARRGKARPANAGERGKPSITALAAVARWSRGTDIVTMVDARPKTGRHHQIRVHLRSLEAPILGDPLYGKRTLRGMLDGSPCTRLALHAASLSVTRPDGRTLTIEAPLATDLSSLRDWLDATWTRHSPRQRQGQG
jgi:tRNA pseudouridine32 synthase/23S rRNA pseudouridine746 synthase